MSNEMQYDKQKLNLANLFATALILLVLTLVIASFNLAGCPVHLVSTNCSFFNFVISSIIAGVGFLVLKYIRFDVM